MGSSELLNHLYSHHGSGSQYGMVANWVGLEVRLPRFPILVECHWTVHLASLGISFLIYKRRMSLSEDCSEDLIHPRKMFRVVSISSIGVTVQKKKKDKTKPMSCFVHSLSSINKLNECPAAFQSLIS